MKRYCNTFSVWFKRCRSWRAIFPQQNFPVAGIHLYNSYDLRPRGKPRGLNKSKRMKPCAGVIFRKLPLLPKRLRQCLPWSWCPPPPTASRSGGTNDPLWLLGCPYSPLSLFYMILHTILTHKKACGHVGIKIPSPLHASSPNFSAPFRHNLPSQRTFIPTRPQGSPLYQLN